VTDAHVALQLHHVHLLEHVAHQARILAHEQFARIGKAISNSSRLELLDLLCQAPRTVEVLAKEANLGVANTSQHLKVLRAARLIEAEKSGLFVTYRLADETVCEFIRSLRVLAETRLTEVREITRNFLQGRKGMEPIDRKALLARVRRGDVTVLDVRPGEEYKAGHIPGALSIPLKELERRLSRGEDPRVPGLDLHARGHPGGAGREQGAGLITGSREFQRKTSRRFRQGPGIAGNRENPGAVGHG
jgi:DNA-binding transcriptional ArsR family regulator